MSNQNQQTLFNPDDFLAKPAGVADEKKKSNSAMAKVAEKVTKIDKEELKKSFKPDEIAEIMEKRKFGGGLDKEEIAKVRAKYRQMKSFVKEMEKGNKQKIIVFPSITDKENKGWYKVIETSALYYVYRLAKRMGRKASIYPDSDSHSKAVFTASLVNINDFVEQFVRLEDPEVEITNDGIYIFTLKKPLSDEELTGLRHMEQAHREEMYNVMKPKKMDAEVFQQILLISRQVTPRAKKLAKEYYNTTGEEMVRLVQDLLALYFNYGEGIIEKKDALTAAMKIVNKMMAGVTILSENKIWEYEIAVVIGAGIDDLRKIIKKDLGV